MKRETRLYNLFFPLWFVILYSPLHWLWLLPANFIVDLLVLVIAMRVLHADDIKVKAKKSIVKVWLFGFLADILGGAVLFFSELFSSELISKFAPDVLRTWWNANMQNAMYDPLQSVSAFLSVLLCVAVTGALIYLFNAKIALKKAVTDPAERRKLAIALAVFTAPYTFLIPTPTVG